MEEKFTKEVLFTRLVDFVKNGGVKESVEFIAEGRKIASDIAEFDSELSHLVINVCDAVDELTKYCIKQIESTK